MPIIITCWRIYVKSAIAITIANLARIMHSGIALKTISIVPPTSFCIEGASVANAVPKSWERRIGIEWDEQFVSQSQHWAIRIFRICSNAISAIKFTKLCVEDASMARPV